MTQSDAAVTDTALAKAVYTIPEAAGVLGVSRAHAYRLIWSGQLGAIDTAVEGSSRTKLRVRKADLEKYLYS